MERIFKMTDVKIKKLQQLLSKGEAALITSDENRLYFTGFSSSAGTLLVTESKAVFLIDFRYIEVAERTLPFCEVILQEAGGIGVSDIVEREGIKRLYAEVDRMSVAEFAERKKALGEVLSDSSILAEQVNELRAVKEEYELEAIERAQRLTDETFSYILNGIRPGRTEKDVMLDMEFYMRRLGSEGVSFDFIVVSGKNSSLPHGVPSDKPIEEGDFVTMDFGAVCNGYHSDMTRTVAVGHATDEMIRVYETVLAAQNAAFEMIRPGVDCFEVDKASRTLIYSAGYEGCFGHGLGHSVGVEIHESPSFNMRCHKPLKVGNIMTVEPGIYLENRFGVRIEDMVAVTENGFKNLTASEKKLIIL